MSNVFLTDTRVASGQINKTAGTEHKSIGRQRSGATGGTESQVMAEELQCTQFIDLTTH